MPALTIKNIPDPLYIRLKEAAKAHRRSLNSELIHSLEGLFFPKRITPAEYILRARELRREIDADLIDIDEIQGAINEGRK